MKKIISYIVGTFLVASSLAPVFALADNATSTPAFPRGVKEEERERVRERRQEFHGGVATSTPAAREEVRKNKDKDKEKGKEKEELRKHEKEAKLQKTIKKMTKRFTSAIHREEELADRISSRLDKAAQNGKDVAALRAKLTDARAKIGDAKSALDAAVAKLQAVIASSNAKDITQAFDDVAAKLKVAHAALVDVNNSLKGIGNTATTTPRNP